jgi:hypothetical protein
MGGEGRTIIIHHWDADGICSARLLMDKLEGFEVANRTPRIGKYSLTQEEVEAYSGYDRVIVVDMSLPESIILRLAKEAEVTIFDHHIQPLIPSVAHHNPISRGSTSEEYPSASWVVNEFYGNDVNLYSLLGVVGDREYRIKDNPRFWNIITEYCDDNGLMFDDLLNMCHLLDTNSKIGDKVAVEEAPRQILDHGGPEYILGNPDWTRNLVMLEEEVEKHLQGPFEEVEGAVVKWIDTDYNIISTIARKFSWEMGREVIVVNTGFFDDEDQVYARSRHMDMGVLIERGKSLGFEAGGKGDVLGSTVPKEITEDYVLEIISYLSSGSS